MGLGVVGLGSWFGARTHSNPVRHTTTLSLNNSVVMFGLLPSQVTGIAINKRAFVGGESVAGYICKEHKIHLSLK